MLQGGVHVARRREVGVETLLRARNELQAVAGERADAHRGPRGGAGRRRRSGGRVWSGPRLLVREAQERLSEAERDARRAQERRRPLRPAPGGGRRQSAELRARKRGRAVWPARWRPTWPRWSRRSPGARPSWRRPGPSCAAMQGRLERLRETVTILEQKKAQAGLVEVRLRERCRAREGERERLSARGTRPWRRPERWERRTGLPRAVPSAARASC